MHTFRNGAVQIILNKCSKKARHPETQPASILILQQQHQLPPSTVVSFEHLVSQQKHQVQESRRAKINNSLSLFTMATNLSQVNTIMEEHLLRHAKRQKLCVSPDNKNDSCVSSLGGIEDGAHCGDGNHNDAGLDEIVKLTLTEIKSILRIWLAESRNQFIPTINRDFIRDHEQQHRIDTLKSGISKVISLIIDSDLRVFKSKASQERKTMLWSIFYFLDAIDNALEDGVCDADDLLQRFQHTLAALSLFPPFFIHAPVPMLDVPPPAAQACCDCLSQKSHVVQQGQKALETAGETLVEMHKKTMSSLPLDEKSKRCIEMAEAVFDILHLWTEFVPYCTNLQVLELYQDALQKLAKPDEMLMDFVRYLQIQEASLAEPLMQKPLFRGNSSIEHAAGIDAAANACSTHDMALLNPPDSFSSEASLDDIAAVHEQPVTP